MAIFVSDSLSSKLQNQPPSELPPYFSQWLCLLSNCEHYSQPTSAVYVQELEPGCHGNCCWQLFLAAFDKTFGWEWAHWSTVCTVVWLLSVLLSIADVTAFTILISVLTVMHSCFVLNDTYRLHCSVSVARLKYNPAQSLKPGLAKVRIKLGLGLFWLRLGLACNWPGIGFGLGRILGTPIFLAFLSAPLESPVALVIGIIF